MDAERRSRVTALTHTANTVPSSVARELLAALDAADARDEAKLTRDNAVLRDQLDKSGQERKRLADELDTLQSEADRWRPAVSDARKEVEHATRVASQFQREAAMSDPYRRQLAEAHTRLESAEAERLRVANIAATHTEHALSLRKRIEDLESQVRHLTQYQADANNLANHIIANAVGPDDVRTRVLDAHDRLG